MKMLPMGLAFVVFACAFAVFSVVYLIRNDFAKETMEVVFPAIGAILFSFYLAFKAVWVDAPAPERFSFLVPVLRTSDGRFHGVPQLNFNFAPSLDQFRGSRLIDTLPDYNLFKSLAIRESIRTADPADAAGIVGQVIEYAVLTWLSYPDLSPGANWRTSTLVAGGGGGGGVPSGLAQLATATGGMETNALVKASPPSPRVPPGTTIVRVANKPLSFDLRTRTSLLSVRWVGCTCELLSTPLNDDARKLHAAISPVPATLDGATLCAHALDFTFQQSAFRRFSKQAKLESDWAANIRARFERDFSFEYLRNEALSK